MENTQIKGAITEQKCFLKCLEMGYQVSKPLFDNARYDFIMDTGGKLFKVQIKTSRWKDEEHSAFVFNCYSQHSTGNGNKRMRYSNKDIDYFMTTQDDIFYLYPAPDENSTIQEKTLRILPTKSGQTANISWAKDYTFEEVSKNF